MRSRVGVLEYYKIIPVIRKFQPTFKIVLQNDVGVGVPLAGGGGGCAAARAARAAARSSDGTMTTWSRPKLGFFKNLARASFRWPCDKSVYVK